MLKQCVQHSYEKLHRHTEVYKHFSFLVQRGTILSSGTNRRVSHDVIYPRQTYHSEYVAWMRGHRRIDRRKPWYMLNVRIGNDMALRLSKPCPICQNFLTSVGCERVEYTIDERNAGCLTL